MKNKWTVTVILIVFTAMLSSCAGTFSTMMTAKPTEGMGVGFEGITFTALSNTSSTTSNYFIPNPMVWYRGMPVKDFLEIGGKISLLSASADVKIIPLYLDFISLAADVEVVYPYLYTRANKFICDLGASLLVTIEPIQFISLTLAPKFRYSMLAIPMYGGSAVISLFNTKEFALLFDVSYLTYFPGSFTSDNTNSLSTSITSFMNSFGYLSIGVGLQF